jgi:hypothetical protein
MAKLTKTAQAMLDYDNLVAYVEDRKSTYTARLMDTLEAATRLQHLELDVREGKFRVVDISPDEHQSVRSYGTIWMLSPTPGDEWEIEAELDNLINYLHADQVLRAEKQRKVLVRQNALNKLTKEECDLLNLK